MAPLKNLETALFERIEALEREIELLEDGAVGTREAKVRPDGRRILIDTTAQTIEKYNRWIEDLRELAALKLGSEEKPKMRRPMQVDDSRRHMAVGASR